MTAHNVQTRHGMSAHASEKLENVNAPDGFSGLIGVPKNGSIFPLSTGRSETAMDILARFEKAVPELPEQASAQSEGFPELVGKPVRINPDSIPGAVNGWSQPGQVDIRSMIGLYTGLKGLKA